MRHGEAGPKSATTSDEERKLTEAGMARNRRVLALAFDLGPSQVDAILCSPFARARQTAEAALEVLGVRELEVKVSDSLEPTSTPYEFYGVLSKFDLKTSKILAVSHQPFVSALVSDLLGAEAGRIAMPTSSIARIDIEEGKEPSHGTGVLAWLVS